MSKKFFSLKVYITLVLTGLASSLVYSCQKTTTTPSIETKRLLLRYFNLSDTQDLYEVMRDREVMKFSPSGPRTLEQTESYIKRLLEHYAQHGFGKLAVVDKTSGKVIGICGLQKACVDGKETVELGYRLARQYWNQGLMSEATKAAKEHAFEQLKLPEIVSCIEQENEASIRIAEKNGLTYWKDGEFLGKTCRIYKITKP